MLEQDHIVFMDTSGLRQTPGIRERARETCIRAGLEKRFPGEKFEQIRVCENSTGEYRGKASLLEKAFGGGVPVSGLPDYIEVEIRHRIGDHAETLIVWSPLSWNGRFAGTAGGGTSTGGRGYLTRPLNTQRGWTMPTAVMNGFTAATMNAGNAEGFHDYILDHRTGEFSRELYENWRIRSTHNMTRFGKAIAEILHDRPVEFSYMNGGSGGGRQSLMEVQNYPEDYDGVWASCPAINWNQFLLGSFWPLAVMNDHHHFLSSEKNQFFLEQVWNSVGGKESYFHREEVTRFDAASCIGMKAPGGLITVEDAEVMNEIWRGPHRENGERLWYGYYPGDKNWQKIIPVAAYYYPLFPAKCVKEVILSRYHARWITGNPKQTFRDITGAQLERLYDEGERKFGDSDGNNPAIDAFAARGGKLMMDHGMDDPLIPTEGTIAWYRKLWKHFGEERLDQFCRMYITPGDSHGNCWGNGPGITESDGMRALIDWREHGKAPEVLRKVRVQQKTGEILEESGQKPWRN